ncbi:MAG: phosphoribosylaminoimidazolesuccinocarboxamide synthase [Clostridia bacterium]|nr:phosphoribosylaminoimidazolesuccinocarboxamide synthase [Clostridia bacterium]MDD4387452.1 phosphoribosylaminoimidazolesuccinocarboxamide synthase [Clostridia bacterium]
MILVQGTLLHRGKANDVYTTGNENLLIIDHSDRISAGNGAKTDVIFGKGKSNNAVSELVFNLLEKVGVKTHFVERYSDTAMVVKRAEMILLEVICRNKTWGSFCKRYECDKGITVFPAGVEFCLKDDALGDPFMPEWAITTLGYATAEEVKLIEQFVRKANYVMLELFDKLGLELIDFKLEFGRLKDRSIIVCDEISLDTCRLIDNKTGQNLDKDRFRNNLGGVKEAYEEVLNRLK